MLLLTNVFFYSILHFQYWWIFFSLLFKNEENNLHNSNCVLYSKCKRYQFEVEWVENDFG